MIEMVGREAVGVTDGVDIADEAGAPDPIDISLSELISDLTKKRARSWNS